MPNTLGIDIGGTGIKAAIVNTTTGELLTERIKIQTPRGAEPNAVAEATKTLVSRLDLTPDMAIGIGFPSILKNGVCHSATNVSKQWLGKNLNTHFGQVFPGHSIISLNDADAAGNAEMTFGQGKNVQGTVILLTLGTGIGSAFYLDGNLVPNTELGLLQFKGDIAERYASNKVRKENDLDWATWGARLNEYLSHIDFIFSPDLIILGGGVSKKIDFYKDKITTNCKVVKADLENAAGTIGAAVSAADEFY